MHINTETSLSKSLSESQSELLTLLKSPQKKSSEWQEKTARLVALEHSKSLNADIDDAEYFRALAICKLAQTSGVTDAKKKNLQAVRFRTQQAPALITLGAQELFIPGLELLLPLRGDWTAPYISQELLNPKVDKKGLSALLKWADKTSTTPNELITTLLSRTMAVEQVSEKLILLLIKHATSSLKFQSNSSSEIAAQNLYSAVVEIAELLQKPQSKKIALALMSLLKACVDKSRHSHPTIVIQGPFIAAVRKIQDQVTQASTKKLAQALVTEQVSAVLSVLNDLIRFGGTEGTGYGKQILPALGENLPNFVKAFDEASKACPSLKQLKAENEEENSLEDTATSIYARLLPAWHDFASSQDDSTQLSLLTSNLYEAAALNGVELLGKPGDKVAFDPVGHRLQKSDQQQSDTVEILKPAVIFRRQNSYRIVLPAIVSPA
jgi:hypothetical protein